MYLSHLPACCSDLIDFIPHCPEIWSGLAVGTFFTNRMHPWSSFWTESSSCLLWPFDLHQGALPSCLHCPLVWEYRHLTFPPSLEFYMYCSYSLRQHFVCVHLIEHACVLRKCMLCTNRGSGQSLDSPPQTVQTTHWLLRKAWIHALRNNPWIVCANGRDPFFY